MIYLGPKVLLVAGYTAIVVVVVREREFHRTIVVLHSWGVKYCAKCLKAQKPISISTNLELF